MGVAALLRSPLGTLVEFGRRVLLTNAPQEILPLLADAGVEHLGADGAAVVRVGEDGGMQLAASAGLPTELSLPGADVELGDLAAHFVDASSGRFARAEVLPLVSDGDLFGGLVLLFRSGPGLAEPRRELAEGLVGLAAMALRKSYQFDALSRSLAEVRDSRELLLRTEKLRAMGEASAGIAHDLKNLLHPLFMHVDLLKRRLRGESESVSSVLAGMERVLRRGLETVERLREFSRQSPDQAVEIVDVNRVVTEATELALFRIRSVDSHVILDAAMGEPPPVRLKPAELVTAVLNLIVNSVEAMSGGGRVTVATGHAERGAFIRVSDDGPGIPPAIAKRIFEPFFTTKGQKGTGLGLAMVYAFVQRHGGRITCDAAPGAGTTFTLWFPEAREVAAEAQPDVEPIAEPDPAAPL